MSAKIPTQPLVTVDSTPSLSEKQKSGGILINRNFTFLAIGQAISNIGDFVYATTLLVWVYALTHSSVAISGVLIAQYVPVFLLGPVAGVFVDRWNRRTTMIVADISRTVIALLPLVAPRELLLPAIYSSVFLLSAFSRFFMPAKAGIQQVIVKEELQTQAASIGQATFALSFILGPAIATPLYFAVGPLVATIINAASFLFSAIMVRAIQGSREDFHPYLASKAGDEQTSKGIGPVLREMGAGFQFVASSQVLRMVVFLLLIGMLGAGALNALDLIFTVQRLHVDASLYGPLMAVSGAGGLIGAILLSTVAKKLTAKQMLVGGVVLTGLGIVGYSFLTVYVLALIIGFLNGIFQSAINVGFGPLMLLATPRRIMGRVESVIETTMFGISLLSIGLAGYFGQYIPVNIIFLICGILIVLAGLFGWVALPAQVQKQEE